MSRDSGLMGRSSIAAVLDRCNDERDLSPQRIAGGFFVLIMKNNNIIKNNNK